MLPVCICGVRVAGRATAHSISGDESSGTFRKMRTGAQRGAQESSFDVCSPSMFSHHLKFTLVRFGQLSSTWMLPVRTWCVRVAGSAKGMVRKVPTKNADWCAKENSRKFLQRLTFQAVDAAQVDARHVRDVRQVLRQSELAAAAQVHFASVGADVADHADDGAGEDTWNTREGTFRKKVRTGAQRRAQESSFDVCSPSIFSQRSKFTLVRFGQFSSTWMLPVRVWCVRVADRDNAWHRAEVNR